MLEPIRFELKEEHLLLLTEGYFRYDGSCEFGSIGLDCKRPFGNSDVYLDMAEILGGSADYETACELDNYEVANEFEERFDKLYKEELPLAMKIIFETRSFELGWYEAEWTGRGWRKIDG